MKNYYLLKKLQVTFYPLVLLIPISAYPGTFSDPDYSWNHYYHEDNFTLRHTDPQNATIHNVVIAFSLQDINVNTNLTIGLVATGGDVIVIENDFGEFPLGDDEVYWAVTLPINGDGDWCTDATTFLFNSNCSTSPGEHAESGRIYYNTYYSSGLSFNSKQLSLTHELGHMIGLRHTSPGCSISVMRDDASCHTSYELEDDLITFINVSYL